MTSIQEKIKNLGYELPPAPKPVAAYIPAIKIDNIIYTSGVLPMLNGKVEYTGKIDKDSIEPGYNAAKLCTLNALSIINEFVGLENIERVIKLTGYVNSASGFCDQPKVINGASDLLVEIFGENGKHVRSAIGACELPLNASVEIEFVMKLK